MAFLSGDRMEKSFDGGGSGATEYINGDALARPEASESQMLAGWMDSASISEAVNPPSADAKA